MSHCCGGCGGESKSAAEEKKVEAPKTEQDKKKSADVGVFDPSKASK